MYCKNCGKKISDDAKFCSYCGSEQTIIDSRNKDIQEFKESATISTTTIIDVQNASENPKSIAPQINRNHKKVLKLLITLLIILIIIASIVIYSLKSESNKQNAFTIGVTSSDFTYSYDDTDGINIKTTVIPKYDFVDFSYTITYYGSGLLNSFEEEVVVGTVSAGTNLDHSVALSKIESNIRGAYSYTAVHSKSGKKQYKNKETPAVEYNTELDFAFIMKYNGNYSLSCTITNKTNSYITEIRNLNIELDFGDNVSCKFYTPRIVFESVLAPNAQITLTNLSGNTHIGLGTTNATDTKEKQDLLRNGVAALSFSKQTYQVIYAKT